MASRTKRPVALQGDLANLPEALTPLKEIRNWVCWKWKRRADKNGGGEWTKPPFRPQAPAQYAKINDPATWGSYEEALAAYQAGQCDGIGFAFLGSKIAAFDLDKCRNPETGEIAPRVLSRELKALTVSGLIVRKDFGVVPPKVEYRLTRKGQSFIPVIDSIRKWGERHLGPSNNSESALRIAAE